MVDKTLYTPAQTHIKDWAEFIRRIRSFFDVQGFTEVFTHSLVSAGAFESSIDALEVTYGSGSGQLHTSPEMEMKWVLAATHLPIYQICRCFRDDPITEVHFREFTMLEFYRPVATYEVTRRDMKELLTFLCGPLSFEEFSMAEILRKSTGIDLDRVSSASQLREEIEAKNLVLLSADDTWDDMFFKLLIERIEPALDPLRPTFLKDYPPSMSALAQLHSSGRYAERFEIYWRGMELCNGCTELTSVEELRKRYDLETSNRKKQGKPPHPYPQRLFEAMNNNFPPASGVAVGLERLFRCWLASRKN